MFIQSHIEEGLLGTCQMRQFIANLSWHPGIYLAVNEKNENLFTLMDNQSYQLMSCRMTSCNYDQGTTTFHRRPPNANIL